MSETLAVIVDPGPDPTADRVRAAVDAAGLRLARDPSQAARDDALLIVSGRAALLRGEDLRELLEVPGDACALYPSHQWVGSCGSGEAGEPVAVRLRAGLLRAVPASPAEAVAQLRSMGRSVVALAARHPGTTLLVRDPVDLALAEAVVRRRHIEALLASGVTVLDPAATYVDPACQVAAGACLLPFTVLEGACEVGAGCRVGPGAHLRDSRLGAGGRVWYSVVESSVLGEGCTVGPYAHLRPGCSVGDHVRIGNFVEIKNAAVGAGAKLPHHTYMGEVDIGPGTNIGAGAVVVNYDGVEKRRASIGARAMLGCNANLIAPASVADDAFVAAGTTVTEDVTAGALCVGRPRQTLVPGWVSRHYGRR